VAASAEEAVVAGAGSRARGTTSPTAVVAPAADQVRATPRTMPTAITNKTT